MMNPRTSMRFEGTYARNITCSNAEATPAKGLQTPGKMSSEQIETCGQTQTNADRPALYAELYSALRQLRCSLVKEGKNDEVMPYHIFSNVTINDICMKIPQKKDDLREIVGIGEAKLSKYGDRIMETIKSITCKHNNPERQNTTSNENNNSSNRSSKSLNVSGKSCKDEDKFIENTRRSKKRATRFSNIGAGAQQIPEYASPKKSAQDKAFVASRLARKRKKTDLEKAPNATIPLEEFLVSFPPVSEAPDIMARIAPETTTTPLRHLSNERTRIEATRCFALSTYHAGNLVASHEALEKANTSLEARIGELSQENDELSQSKNNLQGEIESLKLALQVKDALLAEMRKDFEKRESKLRNQLRAAEETCIKNMAEATEAWKRDFRAAIVKGLESFRVTLGVNKGIAP